MAEAFGPSAFGGCCSPIVLKVVTVVASKGRLDIPLEVSTILEASTIIEALHVEPPGGSCNASPLPLAGPFGQLQKFVDAKYKKIAERKNRERSGMFEDCLKTALFGFAIPDGLTGCGLQQSWTGPVRGQPGQP